MDPFRAVEAEVAGGGRPGGGAPTEMGCRGGVAPGAGLLRRWVAGGAPRGRGFYGDGLPGGGAPGAGLLRRWVCLGLLGPGGAGGAFGGALMRRALDVRWGRRQGVGRLRGLFGTGIGRGYAMI